MNGVTSGGLLAGEIEARIPPGDFPVEKVPRLFALYREGRAKLAQAGFDFLFGAASPVAGALAGSPRAVQAVDLFAQARRSLEECCVVLGVSLNRGPRIACVSAGGFHGGLRRGFGVPAAQGVEDAVERSTHRRTQEA